MYTVLEFIHRKKMSLVLYSRVVKSRASIAGCQIAKVIKQYLKINPTIPIRKNIRSMVFGRTSKSPDVIGLNGQTNTNKHLNQITNYFMLFIPFRAVPRTSI